MPEGGALQSVVERFVTSALSEARQRSIGADAVIHERLAALSEMLGGYDFSEVVAVYWRGHDTGDDALQTNVVRWLRGEFSTKTDARNALGVRTIVDDSNVYDHPGRVWARRSPGGANPTQRRVLDVTGELNRPRQSHAQVHGGSHEGSSRPQRRSRFSGGTVPTG